MAGWCVACDTCDMCVDWLAPASEHCCVQAPRTFCCSSSQSVSQDHPVLQGPQKPFAALCILACLPSGILGRRSCELCRRETPPAEGYERDPTPVCEVRTCVANGHPNQSVGHAGSARSCAHSVPRPSRIPSLQKVLQQRRAFEECPHLSRKPTLRFQSSRRAPHPPHKRKQRSLCFLPAALNQSLVAHPPLLYDGAPPVQL
jgi:hypothetical protein